MGYNHSTLEKEKCKEIIKNSKLPRYSCPFMPMSLNFRPQPYLFVMTVVMFWKAGPNCRTFWVGNNEFIYSQIKNKQCKQSTVSYFFLDDFPELPCTESFLWSLVTNTLRTDSPWSAAVTDCVPQQPSIDWSSATQLSLFCGSVFNV